MTAIRPQHRLLPSAGLGALLLAACGGDGDSSLDSRPDLYEVKRQTMRIEVREDAELSAVQETRVRSQIEGRTTILSLVPEGEVVEEGDKLVELDVSELEERRANQAIAVERAYASLVNARQNMEILQKELDSLEAAAQSALEIAQIDVEKFFGRPAEELPAGAEPEAAGDDLRDVLPAGADDAGDDPQKVRGTNRDMVEALRDLVDNTPYASLPQRLLELLRPNTLGLERIADDGMLDRDMGELSQQVLEQVDQITLARQQLAIAEETYANSQELFNSEYVTKNELDRDRLDFKRQQSNVTLAWQQLDLLIGYTLRKTRIDLTLKLDNAVLELEKVRASNAARRTREEADLASIESEHQLAKERLENLEEQIENAVIYAPTPGLVVYASLDSRGREMAEEGAEIRERQTILVLPDVSRMQAELKVHEADVDKVRAGQPARVRVDTHKDRSFDATVSRVSPIADSGSRWSNSNLKVYKTWVTIERDNLDSLLKPNMAAQVTIIVGEIEDALPVPITAVRRQGKVTYVWKHVRNRPVATPVKVGVSTNEQVQILEGLEPGDRIFKATPDGVVVPEFPQPADETDREVPKLGESELTGPDDQPDRTELEEKVANVSAESFAAEARKRLPQFAEVLASDDRRAMFGNPELREAIRDDPVLSAMQTALMEKMRARYGDRRPGGGSGPDGSGGGGGDGGGSGGGGRRRAGAGDDEGDR